MFRLTSLPGGDEESRTPDPLLARQVLSQLSYTPKTEGHTYHSFHELILPQQRLKIQTNHKDLNWTFKIKQQQNYFQKYSYHLLHRKEVIQPHLPIRLPCYDFTPIINPTFGSIPLAVELLTSGVANSHGVTGGVYKARERIHRSMLICDY